MEKCWRSRTLAPEARIWRLSVEPARVSLLAPLMRKSASRASTYPSKTLAPDRLILRSLADEKPSRVARLDPVSITPRSSGMVIRALRVTSR